VNCLGGCFRSVLRRRIRPDRPRSRADPDLDDAHDGNRFRKINVGYSLPVFPSDLLQVLAWIDGAGLVLFEAIVQSRAMLSNTFFERSQ
jgi:hypothetical protein